MAEPNFNSPALAGLSQDNQIRTLLAAYQKNAAELLAIEASQEKLISLVLGVYSAGLTLITALIKDAKPLLKGSHFGLSSFAWMLIIVAAAIGIYALYMSTRRNNARHAVREGLLRIDDALGFFQQGTYLRDDTLYPEAWRNFANPGFLNFSHAIVGIAGLAFMVAIYFIAAD
jgi:hypothetical protein